MQYIDDTLIT